MVDTRSIEEAQSQKRHIEKLFLDTIEEFERFWDVSISDIQIIKNRTLEHPQGKTVTVVLEVNL